MHARFRHAGQFDSLAIILLAALVFRAYVPVGFMPASGTPFLLELCPAYAGDDTPAHHHHHHHQNSPAHGDFQNCPFGATPAQGPVSHFITFEPPGRISSGLTISVETERPVTRLLRTHQPRGPPPPA
jgi:hypothetical protein